MNEDFQILKKNGQIDLTRKAVVVIERAEQLPQWREFMVSAACLCADKIIISSYSEDLYGPKNKMFSRKLMLRFIFCGLKF